MNRYLIVSYRRSSRDQAQNLTEVRVVPLVSRLQDDQTMVHEYFLESSRDLHVGIKILFIAPFGAFEAVTFPTPSLKL